MWLRSGLPHFAVVRRAFGSTVRCHTSSASAAAATEVTGNRKKVIVLTGPTGVGKSHLAVRLAEQMNGEIISCDSVQIYEHLNIGSDKVSQELQDRAPHHLISQIPLDQKFSSGQFFRLARAVTDDILDRGKIPIVVGGTSFYLRMYRNGLPGGAATTKESEAEVQKIIDADGRDWDTSLARLTKADPIYAPTLCRNDWYRLKRALVIVHSTGKPVSYFKKNENITRSEQDYDFRCFFLTQPRLDFCLKSDARCEEIVDRGLIEETAKIYGMGLLYEHTVGSAIGYKQAIQYLNAEWLTPLKISRQRKSRRLLKFISDYQATVRRYARTQMGYHNKDTQFMWLDASEPDVQVREEQLITSIKQLYESTEADYESALAENAEFRTASYQITPKEEKLMKRWIPENTLYNTPQHIEAKLESIEAALIVHKMLEVEEKTTDDEKTPVVLSKRAKNRSLEGR